MKKLLLLAPLASVFCPAAELTLTATNPLDSARSLETLELSAEQLSALEADSLHNVHVKDSAGTELVGQAVDTDGDPLRRPDLFIFQSDFGPGETKTFTLSTGRKPVFSKDQWKAYGRFNRERFDDFAWENDRVAHRTYGAALETWMGEPLISSTIDVWSKRTPKLVINDWYLTEDYHVDHGEGADFYSAGPTRGCGGNGLWADDRLWTSRNFTHSKVLANGPIRVLFELEYAPFRVGPIAVSETKRISLDAGSQLNQIRSTYTQLTRPHQQTELTMGIGLKKVSGELVANDPELGMLSKWEPISGNDGNQGLAVLVDPSAWVKVTSDDLNHLLLAKVPADGKIDYWAGSAWDKAGRITDADAWQAHLKEVVARRSAPIEITVNTP